jgi:hypothetical protein
MTFPLKPRQSPPLNCRRRSRSPDQAREETRSEAGSPHGRGEEAEDGVLGGATGPPQARIRGKPLLDREAEAATERRAGPQRGPDQDLVPEQEGQDQESVRPKEPPRLAADGARPLQPLDDPPVQRRGGAPGDAQPQGEPLVGPECVGFAFPVVIIPCFHLIIVMSL